MSRTHLLFAAALVLLALQLYASHSGVPGGPPGRETAAGSASVAPRDVSAAPVSGEPPADNPTEARRRVLWSVRPESFWRAMPLPAAPPRDPAWVRARVRETLLEPDEVPIDRVAWARSLPEALQLARQRHRIAYLLIDRGNVFTGRA